MAFHPDIVVLSSESPQILLAVEAKTMEADAANLSNQLKQYLLRMSCPLGLIVYPGSVSLYRNEFSALGAESIREVGTFRFRVPPWGVRELEQGGERDFERRVQTWLEQLARTSEVSAGSPEMKIAFENYVLPALSGARIRAAGPRT